MKTPPRILLVDDDRAFTPLVQEYLTAKGVEVEMKHSGEEGKTAFLQGRFDLCVLDVKMPITDGFTLAQEIRSRDPHMPIIFLSAQAEKDYRIKGLTLGADDYMTKPFSMEELFLRIHAVLRRTVAQQQHRRESVPWHELGRYRFNPVSRELHLHTAVRKLTGTEARLLEMFLESPDGVIDREPALKRVWGDDDGMRGRSLNVYVSKLRRYLKDDPDIEILNVHGTGYRLVVGNNG